MNPSFHENYYRLNQYFNSYFHENNFHENNCPPSHTLIRCACQAVPPATREVGHPSVRSAIEERMLVRDSNRCSATGGQGHLRS